jgi:UTP--glucose-1-phosphate uridylyltransferase
MMQLTGGAPKELLSIAGKPVLRIVAEECGRSGVEELLVVVAPGKEEIIDYLRPLAGQGVLPGRIEFTTQYEPRGLADAIRHGRDFAGNEPLVVALPDNLFPDRPAVEQVIETFLRTGKNVVGMVEIHAMDAGRRGATPVYPGVVTGDEFRIAAVPEKGSRDARFDTGGAASAYTGIGRFVLTNECFDLIDDIERSLRPGVELDDIALMQRLLERDRLVGRRLHGRFLDVGVPEGYREAEEIFAAAAR